MSEVTTVNPSNEIQNRQKQAVEEETTRTGPVFRADVDIVERPDAFVVTADMPGVSAREVNVRLEDGVLSIDASPAWRPDPAWTPVYAEYQVGSYHRRFVLPDRVDGSRIGAEMREGVLELVLPKLEQHQPRRVEVRG